MILRTFASIFPRQSASSLILASSTADADSTGTVSFMFSSNSQLIWLRSALRTVAKLRHTRTKRIERWHGISFSLSLFKPKTFTIQPVAAHVEHTVMSRPEVFERCARRQFNQVLFRKVLTQVLVELITYV